MPDTSKYESLIFPETDSWGVVMPADVPFPLTQKESITVDDLVGLPLFYSGQSWKNDIPRWAKDRMDDLHLEGSFGLGYLPSFDKLVDMSPESGMVFRPLKPKLETNLYLVWKKYQTFSPIAERFLKQIKKSFGQK